MMDPEWIFQLQVMAIMMGLIIWLLYKGDQKMTAKTGIIVTGRKPVRYHSPKDDSNLADLDQRKLWGKMWLNSWISTRKPGGEKVNYWFRIEK